MPQLLTNLIEQLRSLPPARQVVLGVTATGSLAFFLWLGSGAATPEYRAAWRGLPEDEIGRVIEALSAENVPYKIGDAGSSVLVPAESVYEARIRLATRGLPSGSGSGFELFDRPSFGVTDFVHRVNYSRAVQGELARSIEQLEPVSRARVQVVIPEYRSVLSASKRHPSASVVVRLAPGRHLEDGQVRAVVHLVASAIEALDPKHVTVVDDAGQLLAPLGEGPGSGGLQASGAPAFQRRLESDLAGRVETILERVAGPGRVVARVHADLDWTEQETTQEIFDPESQVARSEQRTEELSSDGGAGVGGVPGVASNTPDGDAAGATGGAVSGAESSRTSETVNFEISKTVRHEVQPRGRLERLSVAVLVADPETSAEGGAPEPWGEADLTLFESLARQAVGFDEKRGDQITVSNAPFRTPVTEIDDGFVLGPQAWILIGHALRGLALLVALVLFAKLVVSPLATAVAQDTTGGSLPARVGDLEARLASGESGALASGSDLALGAGAPSRASEESVRALKGWLSQG